MSLRNRIAVYYVAVTGALAAIVFLILYGIMYRTVHSHMNDNLEAESLEIFNSIVVLSDDIIFADEGEWSEQEHARAEVDPVFVQVVDPRGVVLRKSPSLRGAMLQFDPALREKTFFDSWLLGSSVHQVQLPIRNPGGRDLGFLIIAMSNEDADMIFSTMRLVLMIIFPIVMFLVFAISRFIAGRSIAPIQNVMMTAERITSHSLDERIALPGTHDELGRLASTINGLLDRLRDALVRERQFTADASHELRTPLAAVRGTLEVLVRKPRTQEHYAEKVRYCIEEVDRMSRLVEQLLLLARSDSGTVAPVYVPVDLPQHIRILLDRMSTVIDPPVAEIRLNMPEHGIVRADAAMIDMVLENILSNAIKYSGEEPVVTISLRHEGGAVVLTIADNGIGMAPGHVARIFDRFYRIDEARASDVEGAGLGLAIVKRLADLQHIGIEVVSASGKGTSFVLSFESVQAS